MPWDPIRLSSGYSVPSIAFGTWTMGNGQTAIDQVDQALSVGFDHLDTAQLYRNEAEVGVALRESGLAREDVFITTKYSGTDGLDMDASIRNSLAYLGVKYVDLYLIHWPGLGGPDIPTAWAKMEKVKEAGLARHIGVSNFDEKDLEILLASAKIKPAVNQIFFHPYIYRRQLPILECAAKHGIVIEAYSSLTPITRQPGGPLDAPMHRIASRLGATIDQVLLAWTKSKGVVVVTTSSKKTRLQGYLAAGDLELTQEDIEALDAAGAVGEKRRNAQVALQWLGMGGLVGAVVLATCSYFDVRLFWMCA